MNKQLKLFLFSVLFLCSCGVNYRLNQAKKLEEKGYYIDAIKKYLEINKKYENTLSGARALYDAARIYHRKLKVYFESEKLYNSIINKYSKSDKFKEIVKLAKIGIFDSPNYFPFGNGSIWVEGDSETGGKNMRIEWLCVEISTYTHCLIQKKFLAGKKFVTQFKRYYTKEEFQLRESLEKMSSTYTVLLYYPFEIGKTWITESDGRKIELTIVSNDAEVKTHAGVFKGCLKIKEVDLKFPQACKYEYYAPEVGHILTTISAVNSKREYRNNELIYYKISSE